MEEEYRQDTIAVDTPEFIRLPLSQMYQPQYQSQEKQQHACRTEETFLLAYRTEDKVSILLRHELQLGLRSIEETFALKSAGTNGYLTLMHVISRTSQIFIQSQQRLW